MIEGHYMEGVLYLDTIASSYEVDTALGEPITIARSGNSKYPIIFCIFLLMKFLELQFIQDEMYFVPFIE